MTSTIVPPVDLAPGMPSRVVTISATDVTEGGQSMAGATVTFALSDSLDASGGVVIAKTQATITLDSNGKGNIRVPVYTPDAKTWCGSPDWAVLVSASWGSQKAVRVPAGTSSIALSALPSVRPLRGQEKQWAVTGAGVTIVEGSQWGATVSLDGGVLRFVITVPPGGTAWGKGALGESDHLNSLDAGVYVRLGATSTATGYPFAANSGTTIITVPYHEGANGAQQAAWTDGTSIRTYTRRKTSGTWSPWVSETWDQGNLGTLDLNTTTTPGHYTQPFIANATPARNYPVQTPGVLSVSTRSGMTWQTWDADPGRGRWRRVWFNGAWSAWERTDSTFQNRGLLGSRDLDTATDDGVWHQVYSSGATSALNYPVDTSGVLTVSNAGDRVYQWYSADAGRGEFRRVSAAGVWGEWTLTSSTLKNRGLLGSTNLNDALGEGTHHQIYSSGATSALNYPVETSGVLTVAVVPNPNRVYQTYSADSDRGEFRRVRAAGVWGAWTRTSSTLKNRGTIGSFNLDTVVDEGTWYQRWASLATSASHYPVAATGQLEVRTLLAETGTRSQVYYPDDMALGVWRRVAAGSVWSAWRRIDGTGETAPDGGTAERRQVRLSMARKRLLGGPGTSGQAAVAFRFDDGHAAFGSKVIPLLRQHGLPAFAAVSERYLNESGVSNVAVQQWAINDGVEITAHSRNHSNATGEGAIRDSLVTWADDLQSRVGHVVVDTWTFPGGGDFDGLDRGAQAQSYSETYAGRLLLERYAMPYGATGGWLSPLSGEPTIGQAHVTIEAASLAQVQEWVRLAQDSGTGIVLMMHPERLDTPGFMSSATLGQVLAWVAAEREAGRLAVLTGTGIGLAHKGAPANLLPRLSSWTGSGWGGGEERSTTGTSLLSTSVTINGFAASRGAPVELSYEVNGEAGTQVQVSLSASGVPLDTTRTVTLPASGWRRVYNVATLPSGMGFGTSFTASVRKTTAGSLTVRAPRLTTI